jgi:hypothetical protein
MVDNGAGNRSVTSRIVRLLRRILRISSAASVITAAAITSHHGSATLAITFAALAPVLLVTAAGVERIVPLFLPEPLRTVMRQNLLDSEAARISSKLFRRGSGVPKRTTHVFAGNTVGEPLAAHPKVLYQRASTEVLWTGDSIAITDRRGRVTTWRTTTTGVTSDFLPAALKSPRTVKAAPPTGDAAVAGVVVAQTKTRPIDMLVLVDRHSRRVGSVPVLGFDEKELARVAKRAGVEFSIFVLPPRFGHDNETLTAALFPKSVLFRRIAGVQREWGPLRPLQMFLHFWSSMVIEELEAPMSSRRAVKQAAKRPL